MGGRRTADKKRLKNFVLGSPQVNVWRCHFWVKFKFFDHIHSVILTSLKFALVFVHYENINVFFPSLEKFPFTSMKACESVEISKSGGAELGGKLGQAW